MESNIEDYEENECKQGAGFNERAGAGERWRLYQKKEVFYHWDTLVTVPTT